MKVSAYDPDGQPGERVAGRQRQRQGDHDDERADDHGIPDPRELQVRQGGVVVEDERVVLQIVKIMIGLEGRHSIQ